MAFKDMKKTKFSDLKDKIEKEDKKDYGDVRFWNPEVDKSGNGYAIIRFLPAADGEDMPYVKLYRHQFKIGAKWFIENCPTTLGQECPCCKSNSELWATDIPMNQDIVRKRKRGLSYISNILVISDSKHPENEGKVFLYKFGAKIFAKIKGAIDPEFEDESPFNPFNFWEGANFKIKIRNVEGYRNYDKSEFDKPAPLFDGDDAALEALWKTQYSLQAEVSPDKFNSYADIEQKFNRVVNVTIPHDAPTPTRESRDNGPPNVFDSSTNVDDGDADLAFYTNLLEAEE
jgi:hypothetical protein